MSCRVPLIALFAALLVGCAGGDDEPGPLVKTDLPKLVLQVRDLPKGFQVFDRAEQAPADVFPRTTADAARFGRVGGWKARYRRPGPSRPRGPLVVESKVDVFEDADGAEADFDLVLDGLQPSPTTGLQKARAPDLGDEATAATYTQGSGRFTTRFYFIAWRQENATAIVSVNGVEPLELADASRLARKQARRIDAAAAEG